MDEKPPKTLFYPNRSALTKHNLFRRSKLKICNKIGAKMKALEAKPFDQNAEN